MLVITVLWLRLKKEVVSMEIVHFEKYFKYKSLNMEVMYGSPYRYFYFVLNYFVYSNISLFSDQK